MNFVINIAEEYLSANRAGGSRVDVSNCRSCLRRSGIWPALGSQLGQRRRTGALKNREEPGGATRITEALVVQRERSVEIPQKYRSLAVFSISVSLGCERSVKIKSLETTKINQN